MNVAIIDKKTNTCENIAVFEDMQTAIEMLGEQYIITQAKDGYGIGDIYKDGVWSKKITLSQEELRNKTGRLHIKLCGTKQTRAH